MRLFKRGKFSFSFMKYILLLFLFISCQSKPKPDYVKALEDGDTTYAKELAEKELQRIRASMPDSNTAAAMDASMQIMDLEFALRKADSSLKKTGIADSLIVNHMNGEKLYQGMIRYYNTALDHTTDTSDIIYFTSQSSKPVKKWLQQKFAHKTTFEALISLSLLQKDIALISAITIGQATDFTRRQLNEQYDSNIRRMRERHQ
jgi:hypothetical protein